ncbi:MAG: alpha-1,2-fucosyltransferase [Candidatus Gastranaerophilaceae bacterium]
MLIVSLLGGVGNQLFQYASARAISIRTGMELKLDITEFDDYKLRKYELGNFNIQENIASVNEIVWMLKRKRLFQQNYFKEKNNRFMPELLKIKHHAYLEGYFQSEKYFKDVEQIIRQELTFKNLDFIQNQDIFKELRQKNSVSIHIRCGDYINDSKNEKIYNVCTMKYYQSAIKYILERVENPAFYVFSDDIAWVVRNFKPDVDVKILNIENWQEDFYFMQNCKHNIIANSSFSWWGAWLNSNPDKIIVAPDRWFNGPKSSYKPIVPNAWAKVRV